MNKATKADFEKILDPKEMLALQMFQDNPTLKEAVKKVILFGVYHNGTLEAGKQANPLQNFTLGLAANAETVGLDNAQLGQKLKETWAGIQLLERSYEEYFPLFTKAVEVPKAKVNQAR